jgi:hypothetical protein
MIRWLRQNSPGEQLIYTWDRRPFKHAMIAREYFCDDCDRVKFGRYIETPFSQNVFPNPLAAGGEWSQVYSVRFAALMCYRYGLHSEFEDHLPGHDAMAVCFKTLGGQALTNPARMGQTLFAYPYVYRPIQQTCILRPGVNHILTCGFHDRLLAAGDGLPLRYFIQLPKMIILFSDTDLATCHQAGYAGLTDIRVGKAFDPATANVNLPSLYAYLLNDAVQATKNDQTDRGKWFAYRDRIDERTNPDRAVYQARAFDDALERWQEEHCP